MNSKNVFSFCAVCITILLISVSCAQQESSQEAQKPNILLILTDDMGYADAGFQGSIEILTPNLDALAENAVVFTDAHVTATVCSPSRAGLITGQYQQKFGHEANVPPRNQGMDASQITLADVLLEGGYRTSVNGKWHLGFNDEYHPNSRGFEHFYGFLGGHRTYFESDYPSGHPRAMMYNMEHTPFHGDYLTTAQGDSSVAFIERANDDPFFLFLSFLAPHAPMEATDEDLALFEDHSRPEYAAMMYAMDREVGKIIETLKEADKFDDTLIFFLSDNGGSPANDSNNYPLKGFKGNKFEGGHRVPYFIHWPNGIEGGKTFDGLTSSLDIFPTSLAAAGIPVSSELSLDGVNLLPLMDGSEMGHPHDKLFFRKLEGAAMRHGKWKLIRLDDFGYVLYDLENDPGESTNLVDEHPERFESMKADLEAWEETLDEPWWEESEAWQEVTWDIHRDLMQNVTPERVSP